MSNVLQRPAAARAGVRLRADEACPCGAGVAFNLCCGRRGLPLGAAGPLVADALVAEIASLPPARPAEDVRPSRTLHALAPAHVPTLELWARLERPQAPRAALEPLGRLCELEPNNHDRQADLAGLHYDLRDLPAAETHARKALALNALNAQAHNL